MISIKTPLTILAGASAYRHIQQQGLQADDISAVFGASGAAKWLTISGLDRAVFGRWLNRGDKPVDLFGTSVGAFKLAAAAMPDPAAALSTLAHAYIKQSYVNDFSLQAVDRETEKILQSLLVDHGAAQILDNPHYRFHCGAIWSRGWLNADSRILQRFAMCAAFLRAMYGRKSLQKVLGRVIFSSPGSTQNFRSTDGFDTEYVTLTTDNFQAALLASGSIPVVMRGVKNIPGAATRTYRDGGLLDYHPLPENLLSSPGGLVLYPHFYTRFTEGWFDKFFAWRKVAAERLDNVVLVAPSAEYVKSLPDARIPDRQDFYRYKHDDALRQAKWREVVDRSEELGEAWLALVESGNITSCVQPLQV